MNERIEILKKLKEYFAENNSEWQETCFRAENQNSWFTQEFINLAVKQIATYYLNEKSIEQVFKKYSFKPEKKIVGIVMAGNIPLVGFHDFLCVFLSGHKMLIKLSSKDAVLFTHVLKKIIEWQPKLKHEIVLSEMLKNCDAYIATGSNNSSLYFDQYFGKYPNIIRRNRTSVAIIDGTESEEELQLLANDIFYYFGLGCRNVTKIYVPTNYNFEPLINVLKKFDYLADHQKLKNNFDYNLAIFLLNKNYFMATASLLLTENESFFSPLGVLYYSFYDNDNENDIISTLKDNDSIQVIVSKKHIPFGTAQCPSLFDFADGEDTLKFLAEL